MKKFLTSIGLRKIIHYLPYSYNHKEYQSKQEKEIIKSHRDFLRNLEADENTRLSAIESKSSLLAAQTGIIFSLLGLSIPLLVDKMNGQLFVLKIILVTTLLLAILTYLLTIRNALKNFKIHNFQYSKPSPKNVLKLQAKSEADFYVEEVQDILYGLNQNTKETNRKGTNLIHAYNAFRIANIITALLVVEFCVALLCGNFLKKEGAIETNKIQKLDSVLHRDTSTKKTDTIYLKDSSFMRR